MTDEEFQHFVDTVAAAAYANTAILTLYMAGLPITPENAARAYGKWIHPGLPHFEKLVLAINAQVCEAMDAAVELSPPPAGRA
ncbi:hypothetical protein [Shinella kummerowiae]|uniref:hypothetical protein n=1 Tax=Shinella kummerowiae TaxID=417745 RepID=UPI0021B6C543|nr:hypothetical protein [Shinella kummerowiae]MCT7662350.1 hypothetical protein [Shinella kummerowiae]